MLTQTIPGGSMILMCLLQKDFNVWGQGRNLDRLLLPIIEDYGSHSASHNVEKPGQAIFSKHSKGIRKPHLPFVPPSAFRHRYQKMQARMWALISKRLSSLIKRIRSAIRTPHFRTEQRLGPIGWIFCILYSCSSCSCSYSCRLAACMYATPHLLLSSLPETRMAKERISQGGRDARRI